MFFVAICKRALRASIEGYLAVAASTPTYSSLVEIKMCPWLDFFISGEPDISYRIGPISVLRHFWIILYRIVNKNMFLGLYDFEHFT